MHFGVNGLVLGRVITALITTPSRYTNLAYTCLFITRFKSYTRFLNTEFEPGISPYTRL